MTTDVRALVGGYVSAIGERRHDRLAELLHPGLAARRPSGRVLAKPEYLAGTRRLALIVLGTEVRRVFVDGAEAVVIYDLVTDTPAGSVLTTEWLTIEDGLIRSTVLLQDGRRWPEALEEMERRGAGAPAPAP